MNIELNNALDSFNRLSVELLNNLEHDSFDKLEDLLKERQKLIEEIDNMHYDENEFKLLCEKYNILAIQQKLTLLMKQKLSSARQEIERFHDVKNASKSYNKKFSADSIFFNKKI